MKNYTLIVLFFTASILRGQTVFRHTTSSSNISGHITTLDHPQLNGNPNAIIFIMPNYNRNGADAVGVEYQANAGVWYNGSKWTIFNQKTSTPMPQGATFNVLIAPANNPNYFTTTATADNIAANGFPNGFVIDNPATDGKTDALLLVTQNWANTYNDNAPLTHYAKGKWRISNNGYLAYWKGETQDTRSLMPKGARFNVMVINNNQVSGFSSAIAFKHIATESNIVQTAPQNISFLDIGGINGNPNILLFATPYWGHSDADHGNDPTKAPQPYNEASIYAWYDHPNDSWNHRNNNWSICHANGKPVPVRAKYHVLPLKARLLRLFLATYSPIPVLRA